MMFDGLGSSANHIKGGRLHAIAVAADKRAPGFADLPTAKEGGLPNYNVSTWYGMFAPKGTPKDVIERFSAEMKKALGSDELRGNWNGLGAETPDLYGDAFGRFVGAEVKRWAEVVKSSGAKLD
jgi:tripartite-type tricarboxylate transporter receptor subunit TctC